MKNMFVFSTITEDSSNFSSPSITQTDRFVCTIASQPGVLTYQITRP